MQFQIVQFFVLIPLNKVVIYYNTYKQIHNSLKTSIKDEKLISTLMQNFEFQFFDTITFDA